MVAGDIYIVATLAAHPLSICKEFKVIVSLSYWKDTNPQHELFVKLENVGTENLHRYAKPVFDKSVYLNSWFSHPPCVDMLSLNQVIPEGHVSELMRRQSS